MVEMNAKKKQNEIDSSEMSTNNQKVVSEPPSFYLEDQEKWMKKFEKSNKDRE